jgi:tetratricopeptide (TPR) repeat protein
MSNPASPPKVPQASVHTAAEFEKAREFHGLGQLEDAERMYRSILAANPRHIDAAHLLGVVLMQRNQFEEAERQLSFVIGINPNLAPVHNNRGNALRNLKRLSEALKSYDRAIALRPDYPEAFNNRGNALKDLQRLDEAIASYNRAIALRPDYPDALSNRGNALKADDRPGEALEDYNRAIALRPNYAEAFNHRGNALQALGRHEEALASHDKAIALKPNYAEAYSNRGAALTGLRRYAEAIEAFDKAIALKPDYPEAFTNRGVALQEFDFLEEAVASHDSAVALRPDYVEAICNRGVALNQLMRTEEAIANHEKAIALKPDYAEAYNNRGAALHDLGRIDDAITDYETAIALKPGYAEPVNNRGHCKLLLGKVAEAWVDLESRWEMRSHVDRRPSFDIPEWTGEALGGRSILIYTEQGIGDKFQMCRYLPLLAGQGARVTYLVGDKLHRILRSLKAKIRLVSRIKPSDRFDVQCALMGLPYRFGTKLETIPSATPYLFAEPERSAQWRERIGTADLKVGISWQGNTISIDRSFRLRELEPLSRIPGVRLISIQKNDGVEQLADLPAGMEVETLGDDFDSGPDAFIDTAAVMAQFDLVISCDTSIAHLAGALARPTWVALKHIPDWRWMLDRSDSPWYPTMRLFRQRARTEWGPVFQEMAGELKKLAAAKAG